MAGSVIHFLANCHVTESIYIYTKYILFVPRQLVPSNQKIYKLKSEAATRKKSVQGRNLLVEIIDPLAIVDPLPLGTPEKLLNPPTIICTPPRSLDP